MERRRYLVLTWALGDEAAEGLALKLLLHLEVGQGWRRLFLEAGWAAVLPAEAALSARRLLNGRGVVLGNLYPRRPGQASPGDWLSLTSEPHDSAAAFRDLSRHYWGRYVAVHQPHAAAPFAAFRDPSGSLDCVVWRHGGLTLVASDLPTDLPGAFSASAGLDWRTLARYLIDPAAIGSAVAITGVTGLSAGEMIDLGALTSAQVWSPSRFVSAARAPRDRLRQQLRERVDQVVGAHTGPAGTILAEISGGLDSAIVASALRGAAADRVAEWINFHIPDAQGDERLFARAVAERNDLRLVEAAKSELILTEARLDAAGGGLRPSFAGVDYEYDEDNAERCQRLGADTIITGQGGDAVFLQTRSLLMAADAVRAGVSARELGAIVYRVAAAARVSVWTVARRALADRLGLGGPLWRVSPFVSDALAASDLGPPHPWLADLDGVPPVKRLQIHALAVAQLFHGHSRRGEAADLIHPLLSQPLVELCLSIPAFDLALGTNDRALAREAFAERVPAMVLRRRSKGDLTAYYGRMVARSLDVVRPYLLDGLLADQGLLKRQRLEAVLAADQLLIGDAGPAVIELLAMESWARRWSAVLRNRTKAAP